MSNVIERRTLTLISDDDRTLEFVDEDGTWTVIVKDNKTVSSLDIDLEEFQIVDLHHWIDVNVLQPEADEAVTK